MRLRLVTAILVGLVMTSALALATSDTVFPLSTWSVDFVTARRYFDARCSRCHSMVPGGSALLGPNLSDIGRLAGQRRPGMSAESYILQSMVQPGAFRDPSFQGVMPENVAAGLDEQTILDIVAFLAMQGASPDFRRVAALRGTFSIPAVDEQIAADWKNAEAGRKLFLGRARCAQCHPPREEPGFDLAGPSLLSAGLNDPAFLRESLIDPSKVITPGYENWIVSLHSGQIRTGRIVRQTPETINLLDRSITWGPLLTLLRNDIAVTDDGRPDMQRDQFSTMPSAETLGLTNEEVSQIVTFLRTLRRLR